MKMKTNTPPPEPSDRSGDRLTGDMDASSELWIAGVRYPSGTEIWCANRGGAPAWTPDRKLAANYPSESIAAMAARHLTEGDAVPFWTTNDR